MTEFAVFESTVEGIFSMYSRNNP